MVGNNVENIHQYYQLVEVAAIGDIHGINPLNAKLNPICHLLELLGGATIVVVSRLRVKV
jgi:hypothetical protein